MNKNSMYKGADGTILTYRGVPLGWGAGWAVTRKMGVGELSKSEEPIDTHWTVTVVGAD